MIAVTYPAVEHVVVALIKDALATGEPTVTVGVGVPTNWKPSSPPHVSVAVDAMFVQDHPVIARCSVRFTARAGSTSEAQRLSNLVFGFACAHDGSEGVTSMRPLAGTIPARDLNTNAELASCSVTAFVRSVEPV